MGKHVLNLIFCLAELWMMFGFIGAWSALFVKGHITVEETSWLMVRGPMGWPKVFRVWRAIRLARKLAQHIASGGKDE